MSAMHRQQAAQHRQQLRAKLQDEETDEQAALRRQQASQQRQRLRNPHFPVIPNRDTFIENIDI